MEIWKQIDKAFSPNNKEAEAINSQLSVEYIMEEKDMWIPHFAKSRFEVLDDANRTCVQIDSVPSTLWNVLATKIFIVLSFIVLLYFT